MSSCSSSSESNHPLCDTDLCLEDFCYAIPKVELHAHLNGSISPKTIQHLSVAQKKTSHHSVENLTKLEKWKRSADRREQRSIEDCFDIFPLIHHLVDNPAAVAMVTRDVIKEFAEDNVKYLEIRSSPKENLEKGMTRRHYIETVLNEIHKCNNSQELDITTRFLLSVDRKVSLQVVGEVIKLAEEFSRTSDGLLLGIDLSGDPFTTNAKDIIPHLSKAKNSGLKLALHLAEVPNTLDETLMLLQVPPDRIGHGTFLTPSVGGTEEMVDIVQRLNIPIECCQTSNLIGRTVKSYADHHLKYWLDRNHPSVICTDDKGVFSTSLSEEYWVAAKTFNFSKEDIWNITNNSLECIFADSVTKSQLHTSWDSWAKEHKIR